MSLAPRTPSIFPRRLVGTHGANQLHRSGMPLSSRHSDALHRNRSRGFTLIELMAVVAILGILAVLAVGAYQRTLRNAHKTDVIDDLSAITLRQTTFKGINGHYASSSNCEGPTCTYPTGAEVTASDTEIEWDPNAAGYTGSTMTDSAYTRGGGDLHGFDALRFMPNSARSWCGYGTVSGHGTNAATPGSDDEPPADELASEIFPAGSEAYFARDWFYSYALCDFDQDGTYWAFTTANYTTKINASSDASGTYFENE